MGGLPSLDFLILESCHKGESGLVGSCHLADPHAELGGGEDGS